MPQDGTSEQQLVDIINELAQKIRTEQLSDLWIPTDMIHDAESDDQLAWLLLRYVHSMTSTELRVLVQLPTPKPEYPELEELDMRFKGLGCETFRDPSSRNVKQILDI